MAGSDPWDELVAQAWEAGYRAAEVRTILLERELARAEAEADHWYWWAHGGREAVSRSVKVAEIGDTYKRRRAAADRGVAA